MIFTSDYKYTKDNYGPAFWFIFCKDEFLASVDSGRLDIPFLSDLSELGIEPDTIEYIGSVDGKACCAASINNAIAVDGYTFNKLMPAFSQMNPDWFRLAGRAYHLLGWSIRTRCCPACGGMMEMAEDERAKLCTSCGIRVYPRISPAVIVAVTNGDKLLLARASRFKGNMHSVIAGFVEPGETLEECVSREVKEEVGIDVKNIRYFSSQPWPFPDSLMIAFTAEYAGGTVVADKNEIIEAGWFDAGNLPEIPGKHSVARKLIDWFCEQSK